MSNPLGAQNIEFTKEDILSESDPDLRIESKTELQNKKQQNIANLTPLLYAAINNPAKSQIARTMAERKLYELCDVSTEEQYMYVTPSWEELDGFPVIMRVPVLWGDMDPMGHVNNTRFFRWFESARVAYLDRAIIETGCLPPAVGPILAAIHCNYRRQVIYPDTIEVGARISQLGNSSMTMQHRLVSHTHGKLAAEGESPCARQ